MVAQDRQLQAHLTHLTAVLVAVLLAHQLTQQIEAHHLAIKEIVVV
jgi:hypothetical protein